MNNTISTKDVVKKLIPNVLVDKDLRPSHFIQKYWKIYQQTNVSNQNINGKVFEELIAITLAREGILPFYMQAKVAFIPNVNYDFIIFTNNLGPISLSVKTSLRERYKQADLEALALRYIHRSAKSYLITLDKTAVAVRKSDMSSVMSLNDFILASSDEYDELLKQLKGNSLDFAPKVEVITSNIVITKDDFFKRYQ